MSCENLSIPKPQTSQCPTNLFGIPYQAAGRVVAGTPFPVAAIVLHCFDGTIAELCNEMKCRTKSSVISGSWENSFHYGIGAAGNSGGFQQFVNDGDISWSFGTYKNNTYAVVPPPNVAISWPVLQGEYGINTTPDVYTIDIALAIGEITAATALSGCYECPTASGLQQTQHDLLVQMLAYLAQEYSIPIDSDHIQFHDLIHCGEGQECPCTDIATILAEVAAFCPPCEQEAAFTAPIAESNDAIQYIYGVTEPCCPSSPGCLNLLPWDGCFIGDMAVDGTLDNYILGLAQNELGQWCLTRGCLAIENPMIGCGTVDDPLRLDLCAFGAWVPDEAATEVINLLGIDAGGCLIESSAQDIVQLFETPLTPIDTNTVDITVSGQSDHTLQVDVKVSAEANNQVEIRPDGLFVDFTCQDFVDAYPEGEITTFIGQDVAEDCVHQSAEDVIRNGICAIPEDMAAEPTWVLGKTDTECPVFVTVGSVVAEGLIVNDTSTIDLTLVDNVLTVDVIISPNADNILIDDGSGLFVPDLVPSGSDCIEVNYANRQLDIDVIISPNVDNVLECTANGLYVPLGAGLAVADTDCLDLTLAGGVISGVLTLAPTQGLTPNAITCIPGVGLYVPQGGGLTVSDTNCIDLTIANGNLNATLIVNPSGDNQFSCGVGGAFVPIGAGLIANDTDCVNHNLVNGVLSTTLNFAGPQGGIPNILSCIAGQGLYVPESHITVIDTTCIDLDFTGGILQANIILDPTGDNQAQCLPAGLYVPPVAGLIANDTNCITLNLAGDTLTSTPIISVDDCNGVECRANGLYVNNDVIATQQQAFSATNQFINNAGIPAFPGGVVPGSEISVTFTNTSLCNDATILALWTGTPWTMRHANPGIAEVLLGYEYSFDGGANWVQSASSTAQITLESDTRDTIQAQALHFTTTVAPGASIDYRMRAVIQDIGGVGRVPFFGGGGYDAYSVTIYTVAGIN